jgi:hypothetical protein
MSTVRTLRTIPAALVLFFLGCNVTRITPSDNGRPPSLKVNLGNFSGGQVSPSLIDAPNTTPNMVFAATATYGTQLLLTGSATDSVGGVKSLEVTVVDTQGAIISTLFDLIGTDSLDANGKGTNSIAFAGSNGGTGFGSSTPVQFTVTSGHSYQVKMTAVNFNGEINNLTVNITAVDPNAPPPPPPPATPPAASGWYGSVDVCNIGGPATLVLKATLVTPIASNALGSKTMMESDVLNFTTAANGVGTSKFTTQMTYEQGVWQITSAQVNSSAGKTIAGPMSLTTSLPGSVGNPVLDFTGGSCQ